jgi:hypothetical protein
MADKTMNGCGILLGFFLGGAIYTFASVFCLSTCSFRPSFLRFFFSVFLLLGGWVCIILATKRRAKGVTA